MSRVPVYRHPVMLPPESGRVILRPFIPSSATQQARIIGRALALSEDEVVREVAEVHAAFEGRHLDIDRELMEHFRKVSPAIFTHRVLSAARQLLIGAIFTGEYALESAALFNPSIVPHPDQSGLAAGELRFIMSLRATGEGHISSIEFREGVISASGEITFAPVSRYVSLPEVLPDPAYRKSRFVIKLHEMGFDNTCTHGVMDVLGTEFTRHELAQGLARVRREHVPLSHDTRRTLECMKWLAD
jgi:hypothetical protein